MLKEKTWRKTERLNLQVFFLKNRITLGLLYYNIKECSDCLMCVIDLAVSVCKPFIKQLPWELISNFTY